MNKKIVGIIFISISVLLFIFSIYRIASGKIIDTNDKWTYELNYNGALLTEKDPSLLLDKVRRYMTAHPTYSKVIFNKAYVETNQYNPDEMTAHALQIANTLEIELEEDATYYGDYDYENSDIYHLPGDITLLNVAETGDYSYLVNVSTERKVTGDFMWTVEDSFGNSIIKVTDLSTSSQGTVTLEPGVYYIYEAYDELTNMDIKLQLTKR